MEPLLVLMLLGGVVFVVFGAIQGVRAFRRADALQRALDAVTKELHELQRTGRGTRADAPVPPPAAAAAAPPASPAAPVAPIASTPQPAAPAIEPVMASPTMPPAPPPLPTPQPKPAPSPPPLPKPTAAAAVADAPPAPAPAPAPESRPAATPAAPAPAPASAFAGVEQTLGLRWLTWIGLAMLFLGVAFFLKYAYDRDWLGRFFGPRLRIATATGAAGVLLLLGWRSLKNGLAAFGQALLGGGQALLYLTIFAAFQPAAMVVDEPLFGPTTAFALMALVTAGGLAAAVRLDAVAMAFLAVLGGFATPVMIQTGRDARDLLCAYLLVLDLGVLAVASYRQWRALDLLAFAGTAALFAGWWAAFGAAHPQPDATLAWVAIFHLVFAVLPVVQHWRRRTPVAIERFALALANLAGTLAFLTHTLHLTAPKLLAALCLVAAALYAGLGFVTAHRVGGDHRTRDGYLALAAMLLTLGLFFLLPGGALGAAWYAEAAVLLWLGYRFAHASTRTWATVVLAAALLRTFVHDVPGTELLARFPQGPDDPGLRFVWNGWFVDMLLAGLGLGAFGALHRRLHTDARELRLASVFGIAAGLWCLFATSGEVLWDSVRHPDAWRTLRPSVALALLQAAGAFGFLLWARRWPNRATFVASFAPAFAAAAATCIAYLGYPADSWPVWNGAAAAGLATVAVIAAAGLFATRCGEPASSRPSLLGCAQFAFMGLATIEAASYVQRGTEPPPAGALGQVLGWVWLGLGGGGALLGIARQSRRVLAIAGVPLALAALVPIWLCSTRLDPHVLIANQRFLFGLLTSGVIAALRVPLQRLARRETADATAAAAFLLLLVYAGAEGVTWSLDTHPGRDGTAWALWTAGLTAVLGTAGGAWRARATGNPVLRALALVALVPALVLPPVVYGAGLGASWMFANLRFLLVAGAVAAAALWVRVDPRMHAVRWCALAAALLGLTLEPPAWFLAHVADPAEAERRANFSITVTWIAAAIALLIWGFRRDRRAVRLIALLLFVLTAAKLLVLDMSGAQQVYRILAFVLVGITFVGASWLYHRAEKRLAASRADRPEAAQPPQVE